MQAHLDPIRKRSKRDHSEKAIAHTTLAYVNEAPADIPQLKKEHIEEILVDDIVLYESKPQKGGSIYLPVSRFSLKKSS